MSELDKKTHEQSAEHAEALREAAEHGEERLKEQHEALERKNHEKVDSKEAHKEALEKAHSKEKHAEKEKPEQKHEHEKKRVRSRSERESAYNDIMRDTRKEMSAPGRAFSKIIHNKAVEATSEALGKTVARPNAILSGSVFAFVITLAVYIVAKRYGYSLSGTETILSFVGGWLLGILFDFFRTMITGKH